MKIKACKSVKSVASKLELIETKIYNEFQVSIMWGQNASLSFNSQTLYQKYDPGNERKAPFFLQSISVCTHTHTHISLTQRAIWETLDNGYSVA